MTTCCVAAQAGGRVVVSVAVHLANRESNNKMSKDRDVLTGICHGDRSTTPVEC